MEAQCPLRDVRVDAVLQRLFHVGSLQYEVFEGGLHPITPTHIPDEETLIHPPGDEHTELTICACSKLVNGRMVSAATWACRAAKSASLALPRYPAPTMVWPK